MTKAGIPDYTRSIDLETVGDARLITESAYNGNYYSNYFDGTGDYLTAGSSTLSLTGNITLECWIYQTAQSSFEMICGDGPNYVAVRSGQINVLIQGQFDYNWTGTVTLNQWVHFALVRQGTTVYVYLNGVSIGTPLTGNTGTWFQTGTFCIGQQGQASFWYYHGYISNFRILNGVALYPNGTTFTPSTTPLTAIANTTLLTCQSNSFKDNSTNNFTITRFGDTSVKSFNPFILNTPTSMSFDGTGDFLTTSAASPGLIFSTGDFTVECWVYTTVVAEKGILQISDTVGGFKTSYTTGIAIAINSSGYWRFLIGSGNLDTTITPVANAWTYIAVTRSSGVVRTFINGTLATTATVADNLTGQYIGIGSYYSTAYPWNGYIEDLRITKGVARYTGNFTVPTAKLPTF